MLIYWSPTEVVEGVLPKGQLHYVASALSCQSFYRVQSNDDLNQNPNGFVPEQIWGERGNSKIRMRNSQPREDT
jgi:hypothetical protein